MNYRLVILIALCANNILIVNEETIVAISFIAFIMFSFSTIAAGLTSTLAERSRMIKDDIVSELQEVRSTSVDSMKTQLILSYKTKWSTWLSQIQRFRVLSLSQDVVKFPQYNSLIDSHNSELQSLLSLKNFLRARSFIFMSLFFYKIVNQKISK